MAVMPITRLESENAVIGSMLIDDSIVHSVLAKVSLADFSGQENKQIYLAARALIRAGSPVDVITLRDKIGPSIEKYMLDLMEITPTAANWETYAHLMHEQAVMTKCREIGERMAESADLDDCRKMVADLGQALAGSNAIETWSMADILQHFQEDQTAGQKEYIKYGIAEIDAGTYTERGDVVMLGGYPSDGKTALALLMAYAMAKDHCVGFFSLETQNQKVGDRLVTQSMSIDFNAIKKRAMTETDWMRFAEIGNDFASRNLRIIPASGMTVSQIQSISNAYGFDIIILDYVQLIRPEINSRAPRSEQMASVSVDLHTFAQRSGTMVLELAQLSRPERGGWREPDMHDLKETGQFEQDADLIFLLFEPGPKSELDPDKTRILKIAKQKEGRRGKWPLFFDGDHQKFSVLAGPDGRAVMQKYIDQAKKDKAMRHANAMDQVQMEEINPDGTEPF